MALIDISAWPSGDQKHVPIGKRIKKVVLNPKNSFKMYYFKEPKEKYPWEFWNEIIAFQLGSHFGFDVLEYIPAVSDDVCGCLSPSMTDGISQTLIHGQQFLIRIYPKFETKKGTDHTFQLVKEFFNSLPGDNGSMIDNFIEMLVFDSIIGNRDRHQQNWAIIREVVVRKSFLFFFKSPTYKIEAKFSPLFDNGNCLAYNITEENLDKYLSDEDLIDKYLFGNKAVSHVKWFGGALPHNDLLKKLYPDYSKVIRKAVKRIRDVYTNDTVENIIRNIDDDFAFANNKYNLTLKRKELIIKLINYRIKKLLEDF